MTEVTEPVNLPVPPTSAQIAAEENPRQPEEGIALCLSGGGYRAMLFHVGALLRLNQFGLLRALKRVSSVSGGSLTAGVLGMNWKKLGFGADDRATNLNELLVEPIRRIADVTVDRGAILGGVLLPGSVSDRVTGHYRDVLFGKATLQDLPSDAEGPRFVINATSVQTGSLVRFSRPYVADYRVGVIPDPKIPLADAVAASSAFPPFLSPAEIDVNPSDFKKDPKGELQEMPYTDTFVLTDGGVYDNLGLETAWKRYKTMLVSDGGGLMAPDPSPAGDWARHSKRILDIVDNQVRSLRKRQLLDSFTSKTREGAYWGIRTDIKDYGLADALAADHGRTMDLAATDTRLKRLPAERQNHLMNWGYAVCDAAIRKHAADLIAEGSPAAKFPFESGVG